MARLLLLIPSTSYRVADFMAAAGVLGVDVAVGSERRQVLEKYSEGRTATIDFSRPERAADQIAAYAKTHPLAAVVATDEESTIIAAMAAKALGLPHNPPEAVAAAGDKHRMRLAMKAAGLPTPPFRMLAPGADPRPAAAEVAYPCVLKPLSLSASRGVIRADGPAAFVAAFHRIGRIIAEAGAKKARRILVEGYVPGVEVAVEGLLEGGRLRVLALFDKPDPLEGPYFEETIYVTPSRHPEALRRAVIDAVTAAVAALGLREGPIHAEARIDGGNVWVIEVAPRSIGGLCSRVLRFGAGIRLEELILRHALGLPRPSIDQDGTAGGVMMIPIPRAGVLRRVDGIGSARGVAGIEDVAITIPLGQPVVPLPEGNRYLGFLFARGGSPAAAEAALRLAHDQLRFHIDPAALN